MARLGEFWSEPVWDFERNPLGSVSDASYPLMCSVKMIAEVSLELLINELLSCISDV